jgi:hypothetical protein
MSNSISNKVGNCPHNPFKLVKICLLINGHTTGETSYIIPFFVAAAWGK